MRVITCHEAYEITNSDGCALFIDVRTELEHYIVGHPTGCKLIPWQLEPHWEENKMFVPMVEAIATSIDQSIILICRTSQRATQAAERLEQLGYSNVLVVSEGFEGDIDENGQRSSINGWRFSRLPWEQV